MTKSFKNLNLTIKTTLLLGIVLCISLISFNLFSSIYTQQLITKNIHNQLNNRLHEVGQTIETYDELLRDTAKNLYLSFEEQFDDILINPKRRVFKQYFSFHCRYKFYNLYKILRVV